MKRAWRTSSYTVQNEACVEVGATDGNVIIRDTKFAHRGETSPVLGFNQAAFASLLTRVKGSELDLT